MSKLKLNDLVLYDGRIGYIIYINESRPLVQIDVESYELTHFGFEKSRTIFIQTTKLEKIINLNSKLARLFYTLL